MHVAVIGSVLTQSIRISVRFLCRSIRVAPLGLRFDFILLLFLLLLCAKLHNTRSVVVVVVCCWLPPAERQRKREKRKQKKDTHDECPPHYAKHGHASLVMKGES